MKNNSINVFSEIGKLKKVLLHKPGYELENLMPDYLEKLLFDDIPYLKVAREEHDAFADILRENGTEVVYLADLVSESLIDDSVKEAFVDEFIFEAGVDSPKKISALKNYYMQLSTKEMVCKMMAGFRVTELEGYEKRNLIDYLYSDYPFIVDPMPNLYFTRDPFSTVGNGVSLHRMRTITRNRETLFGKYVFKYHPDYKDTPLWYDRNNKYSIEGGDVLVLNKETIAVGISQRTDANAIEIFAKNVLKEGNTFKKVIAIDIPKHRAFMHLDTVFTMVDYDKFTIHPNITKKMSMYDLTMCDGNLKINEEHGTIDDILKKHLNLDKINVIKCGNGNVIDAAREQWNDGSNTLAISPGNVVVYSRNYVSNRVLEENGVKTHVIPSAELSRGRGGPRCMSMPLVREDI